MVYQNARRQGITNTLMSGPGHIARQEGRTVLVLGTAAGSGAEQFRVHYGQKKAREILCYTLIPDGKMTITSPLYKFLP